MVVQGSGRPHGHDGRHRMHTPRDFAKPGARR
jgi:hypothetical protein